MRSVIFILCLCIIADVFASCDNYKYHKHDISDYIETKRRDENVAYEHERYERSRYWFDESIREMKRLDIENQRDAEKYHTY